MLTVLIKFAIERRCFIIKLKGLDQKKKYLCDYDGLVRSGALLMNAGINLYELPERDGYSTALHFTEVKD